MVSLGFSSSFLETESHSHSHPRARVPASHEPANGITCVLANRELMVGARLLLLKLLTYYLPANAGRVLESPLSGTPAAHPVIASIPLPDIPRITRKDRCI